MKQTRFSIIQLIRHVVQAAAFLFLPELFITVLRALGEVVTALTNGEFSIAAFSAQLITLAVIFLFSAVWGRVFCGYLCSFGALQELIFWISKKLFPKKPRIPTRLDQVLQYLKYLVLAFIVVGLWIMALPMDASLSPWGVFGMLISGNRSVMAAAVGTWGFVLLLAFLIGSFFTERFFCRYFCPLGALFTLISGKRGYKIRRDESACIHCGLCEKACGMGVSILKTDVVSSGRCIDCMQCLTVCPKECLSANPAPAVAGTAAAVAMCGLVQIGTLTVPENTATSGVYQFDTSETGNYVDGVYTGVGTGFRGDTQVQVTVEHGYITDITILSYEDDAEFFQEAQASILDQILSKQSVDVQVVSGATFSSNSIMQAVANALGLEQQADSDVSGQTQAPGKGSASQRPGNDENNEDEERPSTDSEQNSNSTLDLSSLADGTYQGEGEGFRGTTSVSVTVEDGRITDITIISYEDDVQFFDRAADSIIQEILQTQSLDVSCVSGATFSSNGILEAVASALHVDFDNPNQTISRQGGHKNGSFHRIRPDGAGSPPNMKEI